MSEKPEALADRLDDERMNLIERLADENERLHDELRQSSIDITLAEVERLKAENERLREALKLALNSHGRMLLSDPPQDAWKFNRVDEVIVAALRREAP